MSSLMKRFVACVVVAVSCAVNAFADYPIFWQRYTADPSAFVWNGRLYLFCSHDTYDKSRGYGYYMNDITCISTVDMKNWTDHGEVFSYKDSQWGATLTWAPQVVERGGKFFLYYGNGGNAIGVAVADSPTGPYKDSRTKPLVDGETPGVNIYDAKGQPLKPASDEPGALGGSENWGIWIFDPAAFVDPVTGKAYLFFGGAHPDNSRIIRLKDNLVETEGRAIHPNTPGFFEASWIHYCNGHYYYSYSGHWFKIPSNIDYVMSDNPMYGYANTDTVLPNPPDNDGFNNHHSIVEYKGKWYIAYHNRTVVHEQMKAAANGLQWCKDIDGVNDHRAHEYMRSVCIDRVFYNADGTMKTTQPTVDGLEQLCFVNPYQRCEAEMMAKGWGIKTDTGGSGRYVSSLHKNDYTCVKGVDFGDNGCSSITASVRKCTGKIEVRLDSLNGERLATLNLLKAKDEWTELKATCKKMKGVHDVYFIFSCAGCKIDWWRLNL